MKNDSILSHAEGAEELDKTPLNDITGDETINTWDSLSEGKFGDQPRRCLGKFLHRHD